MNSEINHLIANLENIVSRDLLSKKTDSYDLLTFSSIQAALESAKYFNEKMYKVTNFANDLALLTHAMSIRNIDGQILEFGVSSGRTINHISSLIEGTVFGFDVFTGLPEVWRTGFPQGLFSRQDLPVVNKNVELIIGLFESTLDNFVKNSNKPISLLHIDCDLYSATKTIFEKLGDLIRPGTVIIFDEYFNYPGWQHHEFKAFQEYVVNKKVKYRYDSFVSEHQQVCVVIE